MKRIAAGFLLLIAVSAAARFAVRRVWPLITGHNSSVVRVAAPSESAGGQPAAVNVYADQAHFQFAIYFLPEPLVDPKAALKRLLPGFPSLHAGAKAGEAGTVSVADLDIAKYAPPSPRSLEHSGVGLSVRQVDALQDSRGVFGLDFRYRPAAGFTVVREAHLLLLALAKETGGLIWDEETRQCFSPEGWEGRRLEGWAGGLPNLSKHFTIHMYRNGELLRDISLGMAKFGLPDVVVNDLRASVASSAGDLINLTCQVMAEKGRLDAPGRLAVDVHGLKCASLRESLEKSFLEKATGRADLTLANAAHEEGDPENRLYEIVFPQTKGGSRQEAQEAAVSSVFGSHDSLTYTKHDEELLAASRRAKGQLPGLAARFRKGLAPGERLLLKAPFTRDQGGNEWMWVEVVRWNGDEVEGILQNDPYNVRGLKSGARVRFSQEVVFDYYRELPDRTTEGNETGDIMERREKESAGAQATGG